MVRHTILPLLLILTANAVRAQDTALQKARDLAGRGRYAEALDLLEPLLERSVQLGKAHSYDSYDGMPSSISLQRYMADQYIAGHLEERGTAFLYRQYTIAVQQSKPIVGDLAEPLIDLALATGKVDIATAVVDEQKKRMDDLDWELNQARIDVVSGRVDEALTTLRGYLDRGYGQSRSRIIAGGRFAPLYANASFRDMIAESEELVRRRYERYNRRRDDDSIPPPVAEVLAAAAVYADVRDEESGRAINDSLKAADRIVEPRVRRYREELFATLAERKGSAYYRLTIGRMLASINDTALARRVAAEVAGDDFTAFPKQLFLLAYAVARVDPEAARPLLRQMLKATKGSLFLSGHFMTMDWDLLLVQAFGVAGDAAMDDLEAAAAGSDSVTSANAVHVLGSLSDPRLVRVMVRKLEAATVPAERKRLIDRLSSIYLPETIEALKNLQVRGGSASEMLAVRVALKSLKPPTMPLPEKYAVAIADSAVKAIMFRNMELTYGVDMSYVDKAILISATKADIPALQRIRRSIFLRVSDEALYDLQAINAIILWARWRG
jgi:hypothetical protein